MEYWNVGVMEYWVNPVHHSTTPVLHSSTTSSLHFSFLRPRPEWFGLERRIPLTQKCLQAAFFLRLFQAFVELFALAQAGHGCKLRVEGPCFAQAHHFKALSGNV